MSRLSQLLNACDYVKIPPVLEATAAEEAQAASNRDHRAAH